MRTDKEKHEMLLSKFDAPEGQELEMYKTLSVLELNTNGQWSVKLGYGYRKGSNTLYGNAVRFKNMEVVMEVMRLMDKFKIANKVIGDLDELFAEVAPEETSAVREVENSSIAERVKSPFGKAK